MKNLIEILPNIYGVKVPMEINSFNIGWLDNQILGMPKNYILWESDIFLNGKFEILGTITATEISFDASEVVESTEIDIEQYDGILVATPRFWDYEMESFSCSSSCESFRSALENVGIYFENPLKIGTSQHSYEQYQTAQQNITEKLLILQKTN